METQPIRDELVTRARTVKVLPTLSTVIDRVFALLGDRDASFNELMELLRNDPAIAAKIISIANSAYYSRGVKIVNVQRAMMAIGLEEVKNIVTCLAFLDGVLKSVKLRQDQIRALWNHSLAVACAARAISAYTLMEDPEKVFTAGLLHDVGKIILQAHCPDYHELQKTTETPRVDLCDAERARFGIDHQEIGYFMAVKWRFPEEFCRVIRQHHRARTFGDHEVLLGLIYAADRFTEDPDADLGVEGIILMREKMRIEAEIHRITEMLGI